MNILKRIVQVLATGYIFVYFSEHLFWARAHPDDSPGGWLAAWLAYSIMAAVFLLLVSYFRVKDQWALFLAGAAFGWLGEGVVVQTAYEALPFSLSFTGLAWHALITVWVGWYMVRRSLAVSDPWSTLKLAALIGLGYGLWAISWWLEPALDGGMASVPGFAVYSFLTTGLVIPAYWLANWSSSAGFALPRRVVLVMAAIIVLYLLFIALPAAPWAVIILPMLAALVYWGLQRNRSSTSEEEGCLLEELTSLVPLGKYLSLFALPCVAVLVYAAAAILELRWPTNILFYLITMPLGFLVLGISLYKIWRRSQRRSGAEDFLNNA